MADSTMTQVRGRDRYRLRSFLITSATVGTTTEPGYVEIFLVWLYSVRDIFARTGAKRQPEYWNYLDRPETFARSAEQDSLMVVTHVLTPELQHWKIRR